MPSKQAKETVSLLVRVFVDASLSLDRDAGWHQTSMLQRLIDHKGELPKYSGAGGHEDKMLREIRFVRGKHPRLAEAQALFHKLTNLQRLAIYMYERFGRTPNPETGRLLSERDIAAMVGLTQAQFHNNRMRGMQAMYKVVDESLKTTTD